MLLLEGNKQVKSRVLGFQGKRQCIVIGELDMGQDVYGKFVRGWYILPYLDQHSVQDEKLFN